MSYTQSQFEFLNEKNINDVLQNGNAITGPLLFTDGSSATPSIAFSGDPDTGFFSSGSGQVAITTDGVESVKVTRTTLSLNADGASINLKSPNGAMFSVSVNNAGQLVVTVVG